MQNFLTISKYKLWVIGLYLVIFPLFFVFTPSVLRYNFTVVHIGQVLLIIAVTFLGFYLLNLFFHFRKVGWQNLKFFQIILVAAYAVLFAVPEEIIFRGIIQSTLQNSINNILMVVVISSAIFGLAHLPNGVNGLHPKDWNWRFAAVTFLAGLPLSLIFAITNSLLIPTLLHAFFLTFFKLFMFSPQEHPARKGRGE
ncbi:MAG: CPBP family intramembrane metalloprotease [Candidatus Liptonbacteria bacterium]|nr:CPBP family intramembrane metalloprotease [Candidatus Liptonbacteria bacterium]